MMRLAIWAWSACWTSCMTGSFGLAPDCPWAKEHVGECCPCLAFKARQQKAPLENIVATHPLELVHLDYLWLELGKGLEENVLVVTDDFTRYTQAYVTKTQTAQMTAKTLWDKFIVHYGLPKKILMDQGWNFESQLVADLCKLMGTWKVWTSPYHLQTNGQCERFNSSLINMLGTLPKEKKSEWKNHIGALVHAYNCTQNSATGFSPNLLMFRRQPHLPCPCHTWFGSTNNHESQTPLTLYKKYDGAHQVGSEKGLRHFRPRKCSNINATMTSEVGQQPWKSVDTVLVCVTTFKSHHKMQDWWENREYVVEKQPYPNVSVSMWYAPGMWKGHSQTLHRNYLLPISPNLRAGWNGQARWQELGMTPHQLQHHLWVMHLLEAEPSGTTHLKLSR